MKRISNAPVTNSHKIESSPLRRRDGLADKMIEVESNDIPAKYPQRLSLYLQAPDYEISIEEFESFALSRLESKLLILFTIVLI